MAAQLPTLPTVSVPAGPRGAERERLVSRARMLAWVGLGWHLVEAGVAIAAGIVAGSVALVGFGADSVIEAAAGLVVLWLMAGARSASARAERRGGGKVGPVLCGLPGGGGGGGGGGLGRGGPPAPDRGG